MINPQMPVRPVENGGGIDVPPEESKCDKLCKTLDVVGKGLGECAEAIRDISTATGICCGASCCCASVCSCFCGYSSALSCCCAVGGGLSCYYPHGFCVSN